MNFLANGFHISPDHWTGSTELLFLVLLLVLVAASLVFGTLRVRLKDQRDRVVSPSAADFHVRTRRS